MKSGELSNEILGVCMDAQRRIIGVGHDQYATKVEIPEGNEGLTTTVDKQMFERETVEDTLIYLEEELLDQINYAAMTVLKIRASRRGLESSADSS